MTDIKPLQLDGQALLTQTQTFLPVDLFQLFQQAALLSRFVREVFSSSPEKASQTLVWHWQSLQDAQQQYRQQYQQQITDTDFNIALTKQFELFIKDIVLDETQIMASLRRFRRFHSAAIAILELTNKMTIESSSLRISLLADLMIKQAYLWSHKQISQRFGCPVDKQGSREQMLIVAMGKLGGFELNFSSDIDLIFFYPLDGQTQGGERSIDNLRFFRRVSTQLISLLDQKTEDGFVFRVDMRLRPYGDSGALVMSLAQAEAYYQEQGREWERFAMIRARAVTGNLADREILDQIIRPFSFRRYIDYGVIDSIRSMKEMIQREVRRRGLTGNIKLGAGGIREVEFIAQSMQLIQGGRDKRLREKNVFKLLPLLVEAKLLPPETQQELLAAYRFLRRLEHCLQELAEKQTQQLPETSDEQTAIASSMEFSTWPNLIAKLKQHQQKVNFHFNALFGEERQQGLSQDDFYSSLAEGHVNLDQLKAKINAREGQQLAYAPFDDEQIDTFLQQINLFLSDSGVVNLTARGSKRLRTFFPALLAACLNTQTPDISLSRLLRVLKAILKRTAYLELLSENPPILQHLVDLAGQSEWMVKRLSAYPVLLDELLYPNSLYEPLQASDLKAELRQSLLRIDETDEEQLLDALRVFKQTNELRVAAALLSERLSISQVSRYLSQLAEVVLQTSVDICWRLLIQKYGIPNTLVGTTKNESAGGFAIIGYGKLGGRELGFGSDLDLVFLFNQPVSAQTNGPRSLNCSRFYTRLAQKLIHFLSTRTNLGILFEVDMRLRPSGSSGLLVSHTEAYHDYQMDSAWTWEHQALVRARFVGGDISIQQTFEKTRRLALQKERPLGELQNQVVDMRLKMREQLQQHGKHKTDLKQASGGLVDIEFLAQYFCLAYQGKEPVPHSTVECLRFATTYKLLSQEACNTLIKNYRLFRNQLNAMALKGEGSLIDQQFFKGHLNEIALIWQETFGLYE